MQNALSAREGGAKRDGTSAREREWSPSDGTAKTLGPPMHDRAARTRAFSRFNLDFFAPRHRIEKVQGCFFFVNMSARWCAYLQHPISNGFFCRPKNVARVHLDTPVFGAALAIQVILEVDALSIIERVFPHEFSRKLDPIGPILSWISLSA